MALHSMAEAPARRGAGPVYPAQQLSPAERQQLALDALGGTAAITDLAAQAQVSRKFVYQQASCARTALQQAFAPPKAAAEPVLFWLPVTRAWLEQFILAMVLIGHSSYRGVQELLRDVFDYPVALGTIGNVLARALPAARHWNAQADLSRIRFGAQDELFQAGQPVLVGADLTSTYCYLLSAEAHRDADTWGLRLLELHDRGFAPEATIADFGRGLRAGQQAALPGVPCRGDHFHALKALTAVVQYLDNRAYAALATRTQCEPRPAVAPAPARRGRRPAPAPVDRLPAARAAETQAIALADDIGLIARWFREDLLAVNGLDYPTRQALYDFLLAELRAREAACPHRIKPVRRLLENHRDDLLAFAQTLDQDLAALAAQWQVPLALLRALLDLCTGPSDQPQYGAQTAALWRQLGLRYPPLRAAVEELAAGVARASSVIENLNSRLRAYFFLRRQIGPDYLSLLQFFLNHRRFPRSAHAERVGKSPAELLSGQSQPHWLELLGYTRFRRA